MLPVQMRIAFIAGAKRSQTHPANMNSTAAASHVVASLTFLHGRFALGAVLDAQLALDLLKRLVASRSEIFVLGACHTRMWNMAGGAGWD